MKYSKQEIAESFANLRKWLKPGDTVYTILDHVSRSGMSRSIRVVILKCDDKTGEAVAFHPNHAVACVLGYSRAKHGDGIKVDGCGMDMGFHIIHNLASVLWGKEASEGVGEQANELRRQLLEADKFYFTQGGKKAPDPTKPGREWYAGYGLKHRWL